jgi:hypothetical protein
MEKSMTDQYARDLLFADYRNEIETKHSHELRALEKQSVTDTSTRLSGLLQRISELEKSNTESLDSIRREYEGRIKQLESLFLFFIVCFCFWRILAVFGKIIRNNDTMVSVKLHYLSTFYFAISSQSST